MDLIDKHAAYVRLKNEEQTHECYESKEAYRKAARIIDQMRTVEAEPVRHGRWIECDYKELRHGEIWTEHRAGLCCSECRTGFKKNQTTYKSFCPACGAKMDGGAENDER